MHEVPTLISFFSSGAIRRAANRISESIDSQFDDERSADEKQHIRNFFDKLVSEYKGRGKDYTKISCPENY